jgi:hypothetical protein
MQPCIRVPFLLHFSERSRFYRDLEPKLLHAISRQKKGTVFHVHGAFITDFYKVTRLLNDLKIPYIYTPHGAFNKVALEKNKWVKKVYINRYEKKYSEGCAQGAVFRAE